LQVEAGAADLGVVLDVLAGVGEVAVAAEEGVDLEAAAEAELDLLVLRLEADPVFSEDAQLALVGLRRGRLLQRLDLLLERLHPIFERLLAESL